MFDLPKNIWVLRNIAGSLRRRYDFLSVSSLIFVFYYHSTYDLLHCFLQSALKLFAALSANDERIRKQVRWNFAVALMKKRSLNPWSEITAQKNEVPIRDSFSKCDQIHRKLRIWSYLLKNFLMENFIFCAVDPSICLSRVFLWNRSSNIIKCDGDGFFEQNHVVGCWCQKGPKWGFSSFVKNQRRDFLWFFYMKLQQHKV